MAEEEKEIEEKVEKPREDVFDIFRDLRFAGGEELDPMSRTILTLEILDEWRERRRSRYDRSYDSFREEVKRLEERMARLEEKIGRVVDGPRNPEIEELRKQIDGLNRDIKRLARTLAKSEEEERLRKVIAEEVERRVSKIESKLSGMEQEQGQRYVTKEDFERMIDRISERLSNKKGVIDVADIITDEVTNYLSTRIRDGLKEALEPSLTPGEKINKKDIINLVNRVLRTVGEVVDTLSGKGRPPMREVAEAQIPAAETISRGVGEVSGGVGAGEAAQPAVQSVVAERGGSIESSGQPIAQPAESGGSS